MKNLLLSAKKLLFSVAARRGTVLLLSACLGVLGTQVARAQDTQVARAQEGPQQAGVNKVGEQSFQVWAYNPDGRYGRVQLVDNSNNVLYEEGSSAIHFGSRLNVSDLPDGRYVFMVRIGREEHRFGMQLHSTSQRLVQVGDDQLQSPAALRGAGVAVLSKEGHH